MDRRQPQRIRSDVNIAPIETHEKMLNSCRAYKRIEAILVFGNF
jgi:hypothetical protein